jgi:signal transduction histidine kinase
VIAYAELLEDNVDKLEVGQRAEFLKRLRSEAMRLMTLIEDILDLSRIESGKLLLRRHPVSLNDVLRDSDETVRPGADKHHLTVIEDYCEELPRLNLDEVKMRQVVVNLITNAIRFSPPSGKVTVRSWQERGSYVIDVADEGPGIPAEEATHIFELFGQGMSGREVRDSGLGIGLHLVKRISELHGAHVGVNSEPGKGSTFWVRLPVSLAEGYRGDSEGDEPAEGMAEAA